MRCPDPEDPKYWLHPKIPSVFLAGNYIEDFRKWKDERQQVIHQIEHEPAHKGFPPSYRYMEGWLDGVRFALEKLKEILGEKASE